MKHHRFAPASDRSCAVCGESSWAGPHTCGAEGPAAGTKPVRCMEPFGHDGDHENGTFRWDPTGKRR